MPTSLSAKKRVRQNARCRLRNRMVKSAMSTQIHKLEAALESGEVDAARGALKAAVRAIDKAVTKGVLHQNTAARRKSRLAVRVNALAAQPQEG